MFHVSEDPEQDRFGYEMFVGFIRQLCQMVWPAHLFVPPEDLSSGDS